jgi:hypothetical protein
LFAENLWFFLDPDARSSTLGMDKRRSPADDRDLPASRITFTVRRNGRPRLRVPNSHAAAKLIWSCPGLVEGELLSRILTAATPRGIGR